MPQNCCWRLPHRFQKQNKEARKRLDTVYKQAQQNGWTADGSLTIRDGRLWYPNPG
ncbi:Uncharacterised protein [Sphingobacterium daejeonense]|nr:Uncharacterised protein [Sphingobacterium daejeonense]